MGCCNTSPMTILKGVLLRYYITKVKSKLAAYSFDQVKDGFAARVAKENDVSVDVAKKWIEFYVWFMIYVGWLHDKSKTHKRVTRPTPDMDKYLSLPYEILQVWREHVLFTDKYSEFCKIVSDGQNEYIAFSPPKQIWRKQSLETLQQNFRINREIILGFTPPLKKEVDALFIFQSSYLKNLIHFNLEEGSPALNLLVSNYEAEMKKENGVFSITARNADSLRQMAEKIQKFIENSIPFENYPGRTDWNLNPDIQGAPRFKLESFQNINFPSNFTQNFAVDHLLCPNKAETYIDEYKKFLYLVYVTKQTQCPSEEVDCVWHYHQTHTKEYIDFSGIKMEKKILSHNPADGTEQDGMYPNMYETTVKNIEFYFGNVNPNVWPDKSKRFRQTFKWLNHHSLMQRCPTWQTNVYRDQKVSGNTNNMRVSGSNNPGGVAYANNYHYNYIVPGCYIGCGVIYGRHYVGCGVYVGCGAHYVGCGVAGCGAVFSGCGGGSYCSSSCSGGCGGSSGCASSGCSAGASGCSAGASGCSAGASGCGSSGCSGGSGCGGSGCGGGGCGGGCGGGGCGG